jgi:hypothetical protein
MGVLQHAENTSAHEADAAFSAAPDTRNHGNGSLIFGERYAQDGSNN